MNYFNNKKNTLILWFTVFLTLLLNACALPPVQSDASGGKANDAVKRTPEETRLPRRTEAPVVVERINKPAAEVGRCLQEELQNQFRLPAEFFSVKSYTDRAQTVFLVNPFTKKQGILMDVAELNPRNSEVRLYANGSTVSEAWKQFPALCRTGNYKIPKAPPNTIVTSQPKPPKKAKTTKAAASNSKTKKTVKPTAKKTQKKTR
ncbi:hypothetical protein [Stenoxybacter acetivorans]|uniref:hypothetical protein n=1 Tax=Stenoxybacter acetivorans TaxID=422441 RepID=UPI00068A0FC3|nr:hypothetical protein [Stenoxybacter acetivorans]